MKKPCYVLTAVLVLISVGAWLWLKWLERSYDQPWQKIEDGLYVGKAVDEPPSGTEAVVNLCGRKDPYQVEAHLWAPIFEGGKDPDVEWLRRVVKFIDTQRKAGRTTYVHCLAGMNRSGAAVVGYLMYRHGWSRDKVFAFVQSKRSKIQPNPILMRLLSEWEQELRKE